MEDNELQNFRNVEFDTDTYGGMFLIQDAFNSGALSKLKNKLETKEWDDIYGNFCTTFWSRCCCPYLYKGKYLDHYGHRYSNTVNEIEYWMPFDVKRLYPQSFRWRDKNKPNCCNGNKYNQAADTETCGISFHSGDEEEFDAKDGPTAIFSFQTARNWDSLAECRETNKKFKDVFAKSGCIMVMFGMFQKYSVHQIQGAKARHDLTNRTMVLHRQNKCQKILNTARTPKKKEQLQLAIVVSIYFSTYAL